MYSHSRLLCKRSHLRHPLAVLRNVIGYLQPELADIVGKKTVTIQKIENCALNLSENLARRISHETGVAIAWLLNGNPKAAPVTKSGKPFTREFFEQFRARKIT